MSDIKKLQDFKKIYWQDIPDIGLYSDQLLAYLDDNLLKYFPKETTLTSNMINNYVKNEIIPKPENRKYYRKHIAYIIVVVILKSAIPIDHIKLVIDLQIEIMPVEDGYNEFMDILKDSIDNIFNSFNNGEFNYKGFTANIKNLSLSFAINAFCFRMITNYIIDIKGIYNKEDYE